MEAHENTDVERDFMIRNNARFFGIKYKACRKAYIDCKDLEKILMMVVMDLTNDHHNLIIMQ